MTKTIAISILTILLVLATGVRSNGQDVLQDTIRWTASGFNDLKASRDFNAACYFVTCKTDMIEWVQHNGKVVHRMPVRKVGGAWEDVRKDGTISYAFELDRVAGTMTIQRAKDQLRLLLSFSDWSGGPIEHRYHISSVEILKP